MAKSKTLNILAISGSLKSTSSNTNILRAMEHFKDKNITYTIYEGLDNFPHFNPEKEEGNAAVQQFRKLLQEADGVIISTPEYAFGVPGVLKNALDWTVSSGEFNEMPVVAISASPLYEGGNKAMASLLLTLSALGTSMDQQSSLSIGNISKKITAGIVTDEQTRADLKNLFDHLLVFIRKRVQPGSPTKD